MKTEGRKQRAEGTKVVLGIALAVGLALMVSMATPSYGRSHGSVATGQVPTIILRVYNYAGESTVVIANAEKEAGYVIGQAGVKAIWWDCLARRSEPTCSGVFGPNDFILRLLSGEPKDLDSLPGDAFGYALLPSAATVYSNRVAMLAESIDADGEFATLLGDIMAHEIGHLLLGSNSHSPTGIMQAKWENQTLRHGISRELHFTPEQGSALRVRASQFEEAQRKVARANALK